MSEGTELGLSVEYLRGSLRTRLLREDEAPHGEFSYARQICDGIRMVLAIDEPTRVHNLTDGTVNRIGVPASELFVWGQKNTDLELIKDDLLPDNPDHFVLTGDSWYVASRASNLDTVIGQFLGDAPHGVGFGIPNRHTLIISRLTQDDWFIVHETLNYINAIHEGNDPKTVGPDLSSNLYYRAPSGHVELLGFNGTLEHRGSGNILQPGQYFSERFLAEGS